MRRKVPMREPGKAQAKVRPLTSEEVRQLVGPVSDATLAAVLALQPSIEDLEVAVNYLEGEGSAMDRLGHSLTGKVAQLYDILSTDDVYVSPEE
jgi:hypothetical protein